VHVRIMYRRVQFAWCRHWLTYCNYTAWFYTRPAGHIPLTTLFQTHLPTHLIPITDGVPVRCQIFLFNIKRLPLGVEGTQGVVVPGKAHRASLSQERHTGRRCPRMVTYNIRHQRQHATF